MRVRWVLGVLVVAGCGFTPGASSSGPGDASGDGSGHVFLDGPPSEPLPGFCFGAAPTQVCLATMPSTPLTFNDDTPIDTGSDACATDVLVPSDGSLCVIAASQITIAGATVSASGTRPLVLISAGDLTVAADATIDVASHIGKDPQQQGAGGSSATCGAATAPTANGGGFGGSFAGLGGVGADGSGTGGKPNPIIANSPVLRAGCNGANGGANGGGGGAGGGAIALIAVGTIQLDGLVNASGAAGGGAPKNDRGGGGAGSGGMIVIHAATLTGAVGAVIAAAGGGGGEGSGGNDGADGSEASSGNLATGAPGGSGNTSGGDGGAGSSITNIAGTQGAAPDQSGNGGGGGGGGGGTVVIQAVTNTYVGLTSPA